MAIKGLTDQYKTPLDTNPSGRPVRLGFLQKGERTGFGKNIKLRDLDHFRFKPEQGEGVGEKMVALFHKAYGSAPRAINDVRIPVPLAGNFHIEECAAMVAMKHGERGSIFMAEGDREQIFKRRDPETGKVLLGNRDGGPWPWEEHTRVARDGSEHFVYGERLYPWSGSMAIDLILPEFNDLLYEHGLAGAGVVTFITHSNNDIPTLIGEYYKMLDELAALFANPLKPHSADQARRYAPLRNIPIRLYRSNDTITTPDYRDNGDPGNRLISTRWLCHWQLNPKFSRAIHKAMEQRTQNLISHIATAPLLEVAGDNGDANAELFESRALPAPADALEGEVVPAESVGQAPNWEDISEAEWEDDEVKAPWDTTPEEAVREAEYDPEFWREQALKADTLDGFAAAVFQIFRPAGVLSDAAEAKRGFEYMFGDYPDDVSLDARRRVNEAAIAGFAAYINGVADGVKRKAAAKVAQEKFVASLAGDGGEEE